MEYILDALFIYIAIYTLFFFVMALRNLNDKAFKIEKRYSHCEDKKNLAVIIYSHNNKDDLANLIENIKVQNYPIDKFKVYAILDNCNDNSEDIFRQNSFVRVVDFNNGQTLGKDQSVSLLLDELKKDSWIDAYIFIDGNRSISNDFLTNTNSALNKNSVITGETIMTTERLDIVDKIKAIYQKYHMNFIRQARSLLGLASIAESGVFIIKKEIVDTIGSVNFKDINSELKYGLLLSKIGCKCTYNPNIQTFVNSEGYVFEKPRLTARLKLFFNCLKQLKTTNFVFIEHVFSLIYPNFWLLVIAYSYLLAHSCKYYFFVDFKVVLFSFIVLVAGFGISLLNSKLTGKEIVLLCFYPLYSICHIIKNFPLIRKIIAKKNAPKEQEKFAVDVVVTAGTSNIPCKLELLSDKGAYKARFIFKNKSYTTGGYLRIIDALQELKLKLDDYGFVLKICYFCSHYQPEVNSTTNMVKGTCEYFYPSYSLNKPQRTLIWNTCERFSPAKVSSLIDEIIAKGKEN